MSATDQSFTGLLLAYKWHVLVAAISSYIASICIYRRFFHPLARIPGPFLPAVTKLYQTSYHCRFYLQIEKLHKQYGPIVRITPEEVHIAADADSYDRIYHVGSKYSKSPNFYNALCAPYSSFGALSNEVHRLRRGAMNPMFSRQKVLDLESIVQEKAGKVCRSMQIGIESGQPVNLHQIFRAVSVDVASEYAFDRCYDFLEADDNGAKFCEMARGIGPALYVFQQFPSFQSLALKTPPWMAPYLSQPLGYVTGLQMECVRQVDDLKERMSRSEVLGRQTIFTTLLSPEDKPDGYEVPTSWQIKDEAYSVLVAAADTTGNAMTVAAFNVLRDQSIYRKLVAELEEIFPDPTKDLSFITLERLPYLTAVIKEGLRLSFGVMSRLPRVVPSPGSTFYDHFLPAGTAISMSGWMMHRDPEVFPDPMKFDPERWMKGAEEFRRLDRNMVPFGRGSRQCVGMPLAYAELYITLGTLFRRFPRGLAVWKTTQDTMQDYEDYFSSYHPNSKRHEWFRAYVPSKS
ncbi:hypothetical protein M409DRAFT_18674 [Zasmidium cellare ATCC 36951]|uniref:Cytochrome P450 n=1 Tax=Zasmidium cellare ATCC 36951 TaxID=1080233 RepID=A0A6A6D075_ZASCE|nr:uncharacterized protein M409DRAFT_18674 [Zasmidium cellare ATCC 36951]KAF2171562.1 hypothetical protein M409DRAFT_18674 [Zasmidium cellare ATCC 36951]